MNFNEIADRFEQGISCTDSFKLFYKETFELMKSDVENAGLYFVVGVMARSFVITYEDRELSADFVDGTKAVLVAMNNKLLRAIAADPTTRLRLLGEVATEYEWQVKSF